VAERAVARAGWAPALCALGVGLLAMAAVFHAEGVAAVRVWNASTAFGHCYLVLPIALWLAWERRGALRGLVPQPLPWLALLVLPLGVVWFAAATLGIMEGRQFAVLGMVWVLTVSALGWRIGRAMAVPLGYLLFLVPFGAFLVPWLQEVTARFVDAGLGVLDVPHVVTATLIEIPEGDFRVAEACAGLRFLIAAIAFGALYACVIYRGAWRRALFVAVCVVVPVVANGFRALGIVLLGHLRGSAAAGAVDHVVYGWLFFSLVIVLLLLLGLPFRQDQQDFAGYDGVPLRAVGGRGAAIGAAVVLVSALLGPVATAALAWRAAADQARLAGASEQAAAGLVTPPGCGGQPAGAGARRFVCDGLTLDVRVRVFSPLAGPMILAAWHDATQLSVPTEDDPDVSTLDGPGARWRVLQSDEAGVTQAAALWVSGAPAPEGLALRRLLGLRAFGGAGGAPDRLVDVRVASAAPEVAELVRRFVAAQPSVIASR